MLIGGMFLFNLVQSSSEKNMLGLCAKFGPLFSPKQLPDSS